jgi:hypothetical protein
MSSMALIWRCYTGDMAYYGGGCTAAFLLGAMPAVRGARLPALALLLANLGTEQWLLASWQRHLEVDSAGVVHALVPIPRMPSVSAVSARMSSLLASALPASWRNSSQVRLLSCWHDPFCSRTLILEVMIVACMVCHQHGNAQSSSFLMFRCGSGLFCGQRFYLMSCFGN